MRRWPRRSFRRRAVLTLAAIGAVAALVTCRAPTQVRILVYGDACDKPGTTTAITVGQLGEELEQKPAGPGSLRCDTGGRVGELVVQPSGSKDATFGFKVVMGIGKSADECKPPDYKGCIVARRALAFLPHEDLQVRVDMRRSCIDRACEPTETCVNGGCLPATLDPNACIASPCDESTLKGTPDFPDGGRDAPSESDAPSPPADALPTTDAPADADAGAGTVRIDGGLVKYEEFGSTIPMNYALLVDRYEVTVGDFKTWAGTHKAPCDTGTCKLDPGGPFDATMLWDSSWNLLQAFADATWTGTANCYPVTGPLTPTFTTGTENDRLPINCVSLYHAAAFCFSKGKRLPSAIEWQIIATGPDAKRHYPWGNTTPDCQHAVFDQNEDGGTGCGPIQKVDTLEAGATPEGILHLGGNVREWTWGVFDSSSSRATGPLDAGFLGVAPPCIAAGGNCAGVYGSSFKNGANDALYDTYRADNLAEAYDATGFRCVQSAK